jgi:hypothetical protein
MSLFNFTDGWARVFSKEQYGRFSAWQFATSEPRRRKSMDKNLEKVKLLARDLRDGEQFPRSPRATLAGYILAPAQ